MSALHTSADDLTPYGDELPAPQAPATPPTASSPSKRRAPRRRQHVPWPSAQPQLEEPQPPAYVSNAAADPAAPASAAPATPVPPAPPATAAAPLVPTAGPAPTVGSSHVTVGAVSKPPPGFTAPRVVMAASPSLTAPPVAPAPAPGPAPAPQAAAPTPAPQAAPPVEPAPAPQAAPPVAPAPAPQAAAPPVEPAPAPQAAAPPVAPAPVPQAAVPPVEPAPTPQAAAAPPVDPVPAPHAAAAPVAPAPAPHAVAPPVAPAPAPQAAPPVQPAMVPPGAAVSAEPAAAWPAAAAPPAAPVSVPEDVAPPAAPAPMPLVPQAAPPQAAAPMPQAAVPPIAPAPVPAVRQATAPAAAAPPVEPAPISEPLPHGEWTPPVAPAVEAAAAAQPEADWQQPTTDWPSAAEAPPETDWQQPATDWQQPAADWQQPATEWESAPAAQTETDWQQPYVYDAVAAHPELYGQADVLLEDDQDEESEQERTDLIAGSAVLTGLVHALPRRDDIKRFGRDREATLRLAAAGLVSIALLVFVAPIVAKLVGGLPVFGPAVDQLHSLLLFPGAYGVWYLIGVLLVASAVGVVFAQMEHTAQKQGMRWDQERRMNIGLASLLTAVLASGAFSAFGDRGWAAATASTGFFLAQCLIVPLWRLPGARVMATQSERGWATLLAFGIVSLVMLPTVPGLLIVLLAFTRVRTHWAQVRDGEDEAAIESPLEPTSRRATMALLCAALMAASLGAMAMTEPPGSLQRADELSPSAFPGADRGPTITAPGN